MNNLKPVWVLVPMMDRKKLVAINVFHIVAVEERIGKNEEFFSCVITRESQFLVAKSFDQMMDEIDEAFEFKIKQPTRSSLDEALCQTKEHQ